MSVEIPGLLLGLSSPSLSMCQWVFLQRSFSPTLQASSLEQTAPAAVAVEAQAQDAALLSSSQVKVLLNSISTQVLAKSSQPADVFTTSFASL